MEKNLFEAADEGKGSQVERLLRNTASLKVNWSSKANNGRTALRQACVKGHDQIVSLLLAHPDIVVNPKDKGGGTPFWVACFNGKTTCVQVLLRDSRVRVNETNNDGYTPLWQAAYDGHLATVKSWIASGREVDLGQPGNGKTDAILVVKNLYNLEMVTLLEDFKRDPAKTRGEERKDLKGTCTEFNYWISIGFQLKWIENGLNHHHPP